jgi:acetylornithine deacetylase/succinyl-diaminopimelate desuccinylase-like protein
MSGSFQQERERTRSFLGPSVGPKVINANTGSCSMGQCLSLKYLILQLLIFPFVTAFSHYDVISAPSDGWDTDPFTLNGRNGYLYGRGVTDDKGPIIAAACAAADLLSRKALNVDLVFLIEGEEESGSTGFAEAIQRYKVRNWVL